MDAVPVLLLLEGRSEALNENGGQSPPYSTASPFVLVPRHKFLKRAHDDVVVYRDG